MTEGETRSRSAAGATQEEERILRLEELSFTRLDALDRDRTVVIFTVSPLEEHGPHLPVGTDIFTAEFFNRQLAARILKERPGWTVLIGPPVPLGTSVFDHAGTLRARARTVRNATLDYGAALARHGFKYLLVTNGHAGPRHVVALEEAAAAVSRRYGVRMLSVSGPVLWRFLRGKYDHRLEPALGRPLTYEEKRRLRNDVHAGLWETSLLMLERPRLVSPEFRQLPPIRFTLLEMLRKNYPLRLGNQMGYIGAPALARPEFGEAARQMLEEAVWDVVRPVLETSDHSWQQTSFLYHIPLMRSAAPYVASAAGLVLLAWLVFHWFGFL